MTAIQDETGVLLRNTYDNGRIVEQTVADGSVYRYRYLWNREGELEQTVVTMPDGAGDSADLRSRQAGIEGRHRRILTASRYSFSAIDLALCRKLQQDSPGRPPWNRCPT